MIYVGSVASRFIIPLLTLFPKTATLFKGSILLMSAMLWLICIRFLYPTLAIMHSIMRRIGAWVRILTQSYDASHELIIFTYHTVPLWGFLRSIAV